MEFILFQEATVVKGFLASAPFSRPGLFVLSLAVVVLCHDATPSSPLLFFFDVVTPAQVGYVIVGRSKLNVR